MNEPSLYIHTLVIVSEHDDYDDLEALARDADIGDARLRSWSKEIITTEGLVSDEERDFFGLTNESSDGS